MFISKEHYKQLTPYEAYLWCYFALSMTAEAGMGKTEPLRKTDMLNDLDMGRSTLDLTLQSLVNKGFIRILSEPREPLVIQITNLIQHDRLEQYDIDMESAEPSDSQGSGEYAGEF